MYQSRSPALSDRNLVSFCRRVIFFYAIIWLLPLIAILYVTSFNDATFHKFADKDELPQFELWIWHFGRFNESWFYLPTVLGLGLAVALREFARFKTKRYRYVNLSLATFAGLHGLIMWCGFVRQVDLSWWIYSPCQLGDMR